jgi:phenylacetate-CoA ligase
MSLAVAHQTNASMPGADWPPVYDPAYRPDQADPYWFRALECEPVDQRNARMLRKLQAQVTWAYATSDFYRRTWDAAGVGPHTLRTPDDLNASPVVTKAELRADQVAHPPFGSASTATRPADGPAPSTRRDDQGRRT